eukprot:16447975-Heterocapsa_arctica.AAC.1
MPPATPDRPRLRGRPHAPDHWERGYTDGSTVFPRDLPMRRAAFGIWLDKHNLANFASALPGK